jgi:predicted RNA polymerase sigma factor
MGLMLHQRLTMLADVLKREGREDDANDVYEAVADLQLFEQVHSIIDQRIKRWNDDNK